MIAVNTLSTRCIKRCNDVTDAVLCIEFSHVCWSSTCCFACFLICRLYLFDVVEEKRAKVLVLLLGRRNLQRGERVRIHSIKIKLMCEDCERLVIEGLEEGDPDPAFPLLFHENPASRTVSSSLSRIPFFFTEKYIKKSNFYKR